MTQNIAERLRESARERPHQRAVVVPAGRDAAGRVTWSQLTFAQLDRESDRLAQELLYLGARPGMRLVLMVRPSLEFIALTFALFKAGAVVVLIDPGMGRSNIFRCLEEVEPQGFIAIPLVQAIRRLYRQRFRQATLNVTVGRRTLPGEVTYAHLLERAALRNGCGGAFEAAPVSGSEAAAIIFTSGSTGPPKGVVYEHGMFAAQVDLLRDFYGVQPGEVDLSGFPLFALFNAAMGVTTVVPDMDPTRPAEVDARKVLEAIEANGVTQAFGSPAFWNRVSRYCEEEGVRIRSLRRALSAGAPVPVAVLARMRRAMAEPGADLHTPYGATESLPVASISASEVLDETGALSRRGAGTCVGRPFPQVDVRILEITEGAIATLAEARPLPPGEIGEIVVRAPSTTRRYFNRPEATALAKIADGGGFWHRMGDVGYLDAEGRLWFCGRKAHLVETERGRLFSVPCEAIFNEHRRVYRSALVGIGPKGRQRPVMVVEPEAGAFPRRADEAEQFRRELLELGRGAPHTAGIETVLFHRALPVDIRHNSKIFREKLAPWVERQMGSLSPR